MRNCRIVHLCCIALPFTAEYPLSARTIYEATLVLSVWLRVMRLDFVAVQYDWAHPKAKQGFPRSSLVAALLSKRPKGFKCSYDS